MRKVTAFQIRRQKLELPKMEDAFERSARYAAREKPRPKVSNVGDTTVDALRIEIEKLESSGSDVDPHSFGLLLRKCSFNKAFELGRRLHRYITYKQVKNVFLDNLLVHFYGNCGRIEDARAVFDLIGEKNGHSWNIMIQAYVQNGLLQQAIDVYWKMDAFAERSAVTYCTVLGACTKLGAISEGRKIHKSITGTFFEIFGGCGSVGTALVNMYGKCGSPDEAKAVFDKLVIRSDVCWNAMISAYAQNQRDSEAISLYRNMDLEGVKPTVVTYVSVIDACSKNKRAAMEVYSRVVSCELISDVILACALVNMLGKCGMVEEARKLFDSLEKVNTNIFTWTAMIGAYAQNGYCREALDLFRRMEMKPTSVTFITALDACSKIADAETGKLVHSMCSNEAVTNVNLGNALINMYGKCSLWESAREVFNRMARKNVITWTSMVGVYSQSGHFKEALEMYEKMDEQASTVTIIAALDACAESGDLKQGRKIHQKLLKNNVVQIDGLLENAIVNMYGKCGSLEEAWEAFSRMKSYNRTLVSWTSILGAFSKQGNGAMASELCRLMCLDGAMPDGVTFISLLAACSHGGRVEIGRDMFLAMVGDFWILPAAEHYRCMVDLLGRNGLLGAAEELIRSTNFGADDGRCWAALLAACKVQNNEEYGKRAADVLMELSPGCCTTYLHMAQIYAANGKIEEAGRMVKLGEERGVARS